MNPLGYVSRLVDFNETFEAIKEFVRQHPDVHLLWGGMAPKRDHQVVKPWFLIDNNYSIQAMNFYHCQLLQTLGVYCAPTSHVAYPFHNEMCAVSHMFCIIGYYFMKSCYHTNFDI